jgi:hypothetical protein
MIKELCASQNSEFGIFFFETLKFSNCHNEKRRTKLRYVFPVAVMTAFIVYAFIYLFILLDTWIFPGTGCTTLSKDILIPKQREAEKFVEAKPALCSSVCSEELSISSPLTGNHM